MEETIGLKGGTVNLQLEYLNLCNLGKPYNLAG